MLGVDTLAGFLDGPRARQAFLLRSVLVDPWSLRIEDEAPLTIMAIVHGGAWVETDGAGGPGGAARLAEGDVAIARGPGHYTVTGTRGIAPTVIVGPGQACRAPDGTPLAESLALGTRTWGRWAEGATVLLTGTYQTDGEVSRPLLDALPELIVLRRDEWDTPLVGLLHDEIASDAVGQQAVLDRVLDLLLIAALRQWYARPGSEPPAWYRAGSDAVVGAALRLLHDAPAHDWTVAELAAAVGLSRAALARRFTELVGEPPIGYLARWRLALAADLLTEPGATVGGVARRLGYGSPFTFSTAFKRRYGISPKEHRERRDLQREAADAAAQRQRSLRTGRAD